MGAVALRRIFWTIIVLSLTACAVVQPPSGGPEDKKPPHVVEIQPRPDSFSVSRDTNIRIRFSENVDGESFKNRVKAYPPIAFERVRAKGEDLEIRFRELLPETTITILIMGGYWDHHRVKNEESYTFHFSTADSIETGQIAGKVFFKGEPDSVGVVKLFEVRADTVIDVFGQLESRMGYAWRDGSFSFGALPADSASFLLWAFSDKNGDGKYAVDKEFSLQYPDTIVLTMTNRTVSDVLLNVIDPHEPAQLSGRVTNETGIDLYPTVRLGPLLPGEPALVSLTDSTGHFMFISIPPRAYVLSTFIDVRIDSICGEYPQPEDSTITLREPCYLAPDTLIFGPGEKKILDPIILREEER